VSSQSRSDGRSRRGFVTRVQDMWRVECRPVLVRKCYVDTRLSISGNHRSAREGISSGAPRLSDTAPAPTIPMSLESSYVRSALFTFLVGFDIPGRRLS
jgi:hypothetical protein